MTNEYGFAYALEVASKKKAITEGNGKIFVKEMTQKDVENAVSEYAGVPFTELERIEPEPENIETEAVGRLLNTPKPAQVRVQSSKPMWDTFCADKRAVAHFSKRRPFENNF